MRLIDAKSVLQGIEELKTSPFANPRDDGARIHIQQTLDIVACLCVKNEPTVDAVKVVRCGDCKHLDKDDLCPLHNYFMHTLDDYCSRGVRREDNA